jgi:hypothetical protein
MSLSKRFIQNAISEEREIAQNERELIKKIAHICGILDKPDHLLGLSNFSLLKEIVKSLEREKTCMK